MDDGGDGIPTKKHEHERPEAAATGGGGPAATARRGLPPLGPLRHQPFRMVAVGRMVTMLGNGVAPIALAFAVLDLTGSVADLGLVVGARSLMSVLFVLFGGVVADRFPRRPLLVAASAVSAGSQAAVAAVVLGGAGTVPLLMALSAVNGLASAVALPATQALVPQTLPPGERQAGNAILRFGVNLSTVLGASVGGLLVAAVGAGWGLAVDAASFAVAGLFFFAIRLPKREGAAQRQKAGEQEPSSVVAELRVGWREFASRSWLWAVVLGYMAVNAMMVAGVMVLGPAVADETIGRRYWGIVIAVETVGMAVGALLAIRIRPKRLLLYGVLLGGLDWMFLLALGLAPTLPLLLLTGFLAGAGASQFGVAWETTMQRHVPEDVLARVYSYDILGSIVVIPIAEMAVGPIAHGTGVETTLVAAAVITVIATVGMVATPSVRRLPAEPEPTDGHGQER